MPLFAPVLNEIKKFLDPMQDSRVIQRSEWLFELEIPIREDMMPGMIFLKEYGAGRYAIKVELLYKKYPDGYLFVDEFKSMAADQHVYINKHDHERWLKNFMDPREKRAPTPTKTPPYSSTQILSNTPAQGPFFNHPIKEPLQTSKYPQRIDYAVMAEHPKDAPISYDYGESRPVRTHLGEPPAGPSPFTGQQQQQQRQQPATTVVLPSQPTVVQSYEQSASSSSSFVQQPSTSSAAPRAVEVVGGSDPEGSVETHTLEVMLTWSFKQLGNRRSRLIKLQKKAKDMGRFHQFSIITEQLQLLSKAQRLNKFGTFAPKSNKASVDLDADDSSSVVAELKSRRGVQPPLKRPGTIIAPRGDQFSHRHHTSSVCTLVPVRPPRRHLLVPPLLPPKPDSDNNHINFSNSQLTNNCEHDNDSCSFFDEELDLFKGLSSKIRKRLSKSTHRKPRKSSVRVKSYSNVKSKPVHRSYPAEDILSPVFNQGGLDFSGESAETSTFLEGSPSDPKIYLGGRFSDQSEPDSPTTAARINARALWYEPCTRLEYRYKLRAWRAEGLPGRPTNSPLKFTLPM